MHRGQGENTEELMLDIYWGSSITDDFCRWIVLTNKVSCLRCCKYWLTWILLFLRVIYPLMPDGSWMVTSQHPNFRLMFMLFESQDFVTNIMLVLFNGWIWSTITDLRLISVLIGLSCTTKVKKCKTWQKQIFLCYGLGPKECSVLALPFCWT